jgi:hypothetical protein
MAKRDYAVGYGKPPKATQFKKGQSGNPRGRPKDTPNVATILTKALSQRVTITENGVKRSVSKLEIVLLQQVNKAATGDLRSTQLILGYIQSILPPPQAETSEGPLNAADNDVLQAFIQRLRQQTGDK